MEVVTVTMIVGAVLAAGWLGWVILGQAKEQLRKADERLNELYQSVTDYEGGD